ncbi:MAG: recombinase family protein [Parvularculaceae bacterium]
MSRTSGRTVRRCAIYTRKSTEDGLEQEFNSLDAQRESCEAFIASQRSEGWKALPDRYDDGGVSGGTLEREAIQRLLADVDSGKVDIVVVYKIDRLTRSLADFARIVERFEKRDVSFVSVTQSFNTSSSMGRLTLNVLLSFAQFEREVTAERIRDKIAASKKKGLWMGGFVPLGYDAVERKLIVNENEAKIVRMIFEAFIAGANIRELAADLEAKGIRSKARANGMGGRAFSRGALYKILSNPIYRGEVAHGKNRYPGAHAAIIDAEIWDLAAARLAAGKRRIDGVMTGAAPLTGKLFADDEPLTPTHATNHGRRYRYYVSRSLIETGASDAQGWRLPAAEVEGALARLIRDWLKEQAEDCGAADAPPEGTTISAIRERHTKLNPLITEAEAAHPHALLARWRGAIERVAISETSLELTLDRSRLPIDAELLCRAEAEPIVIERSVRFARRGIGRKLILGDARLNPDPVMIDLIVMVRRWRKEIFEEGAAIKDLAERDGIDQGDASRFLPLAFLAPDLTLAILEGRQPASLTAETLKRLGALPLDWREQRQLLGA